MKSIALVGATKEIINYFNKFLKAFEIEYKLTTKFISHKENFFNYIVVYSNLNIKDISLNCDYCLVDMDNFINKNINLNVFGNIITIGRGNRNTVTLSSVDKDSKSFVYCLQREMGINHKVEAQEIPIYISFKSEEELSAAVMVFTLLLLEGKPINEIFQKHNQFINC